jgi:hypothetical protein
LFETEKVVICAGIEAVTVEAGEFYMAKLTELKTETLSETGEEVTS